MIKFNRDYFNNPTIPDYVLCKANKERIGIIKCTAKNIVHKFNDLDEITFTTYMNIDGEKNLCYEMIDTMKYILLPDIGFFSICECNTCSEGTEFEHKEVTARSYECLMGQKHVENFIINQGITGSIDSVQFYNLADKEHSLLHLILSEKCPDWKIGHLDPSLASMQRSFEVTRKNVYLFLMEDVAQAFGCVFLFDTLTNTINIYKEENVGEDTNVYISYNNLLKSTDISSNTDDIKTSLTLKGSDDLTVREVNMGQDNIINIDYYHSIDFMSQNLYDSYGKWKVLRESKVKEYNTLLSQYQKYYSDINYLTNKKMPDTAGSTNWTEYGLVPLKEQLSAYEQRQAVMMKSGWGNADSPYYSTSYLPVYNTIQEINKQIKVIESELEKLNTEQTEIYNQMFNIMNLVAMENNFTEDELAELSTFIREDELSSDNYIVTDTMTDEERFKMLEDFLEYGQRELAKVATPQLAFTADMANIFAIPEFESLYDQFDVGNYIWISLRDDYHVKTRISEIDYDFYNPENFTVKFGNIVKQSGNVFHDMSEAIRQAKDAATSVSFNKSTWSQSAKDTDEIGKAIDEGLISAGKYLTNGADSEMVIDKRGIFITTTSGDYSWKDSIFIGGGRILFTDDNWKTVSEAVGRVDIKGESVFGVIAQAMLSGYIGSSIIEGGQIIGVEFNNGNKTFYVDKDGNLIANSATIKGIITASKIEGCEITGTSFNNGNGTFSVDKEGNLIATSATIKGKIQADSGYIGGTNGFTITSGKLYSGKSNFSSDSNGVYIGVDGIALGANNVFSVDENGKLIATSADITGKITTTSGSIGGFDITANQIKASNNSVGLSSSGGWAFWAGEPDPVTGYSPFMVGHEGNVYVSNINATGNINATSGTIANFKILDGYLYNDILIGNPLSCGISCGSTRSGDNDWIFWANSGAFRVDINGNVFARNFYLNDGGEDAKSSLTIGGGALEDFNNLVVDSIIAKEILANYVTTDYLNAYYITADSMKTNYMEVANWTSAGYIRADKINANSISVDKLAAGTVNGHSIDWKQVTYISDIDTEQMYLDENDPSTGFLGIKGYTKSIMYVMAG